MHSGGPALLLVQSLGPQAVRPRPEQEDLQAEVTVRPQLAPGTLQLAGRGWFVERSTTATWPQQARASARGHTVRSLGHRAPFSTLTSQPLTL